MQTSGKISRFIQGTVVVLALGMLLVIGGFVSAQRVIELPDLSFGGEDDGVEFTKFKEVETTQERIREKEQEALEARLVDPIISDFIKDDLRYFKTAQTRNSDVVSALEQSYHSRSFQVIHLRKELVKQIVIPLLDLTPEQKSNKTTVISNHIIKTPKKNGGVSISITSGFSFKERLSIELNDFPSLTLPTTTSFAGMLSENAVKVYEIPDIEFQAPALTHSIIEVDCTNIKYAPPQQGGGGTSNYIWTQLTGDCEHNLRENYPADTWEIISPNTDTWIWEISLVDNTGSGSHPVWYTANGPQPIVMMMDPSNPASLLAYDAHHPCKSGYWNTVVNIGLNIRVRNTNDNLVYSSIVELNDVFNFGDELVRCKK